MKKQKLILILLVMLQVVFSSFKDAGESDWEKAKEESGVVVFTREIEGSALKEFRAHTNVNAESSKVLSIFTDFGSYPKWMANYRDTKQIKKINDNEYIYYTVISTPWPVNDRDLVLRFKHEKTDYGYLVHINADNSQMDKNDDYVRMEYFKGKWELHDKSDGTTEVISQVHADPAGMIPSWLANSIMVDGPVSTLSSLQNMLK